MKGKALSVVVVISLLAGMFMIIDTATGINWTSGVAVTLEARLPMPCPAPGCPVNCTANYQNCTMPAPYTVGSLFNVTVRINSATGMTGYGISLAWNSTFCQSTGRWWLSPAMKAEQMAGRWGAPIPGAWSNDTFPWLASNFGTYNNFGHTAFAPNTLTGTFDLVLFEFKIMAPGPSGIYIWKDQGCACGMPEDTYGAILVGSGWFTGAGPMAYDVIWYDGQPTPTSTVVGIDNALLWLQAPPEDVTAPTTTDDYDGLWHNTDFTITLTATDDLDPAPETYYKINDEEPAKNVTAHGQPLITTESANNTLEYWSVDNANNTETHHILTEIKLDKTAPTIETPSRVPDGDVLPDQPVKVSVNVTDALSVKNVTLSYTVNGIPTDVLMSYNASTGLYNATIPGQLAWKWVEYEIVAYDNATNQATEDGTEPICKYQVIPEFPAWTSMLLILIVLTVAIAIYKRRRLKTPIH